MSNLKSIFFSLKSIFYNLISALLFIVFAKSCISNYVNGGDKEKMSQLNQMIEDNTTVIANLSNEYTETRIARFIKLYEFDYSFNLDGKEYSGEITLNELPDTNIIKLYYWKDNPNIVAFKPKKDLETEKKKGSSIVDLLVGLVWAILAIILIIYLISGVKNLFSKKQKEVIQEKQA